jgi:hypothetical protein
MEFLIAVAIAFAIGWIMRYLEYRFKYKPKGYTYREAQKMMDHEMDRNYFERGAYMAGYDMRDVKRESKKRYGKKVV